LHFPEEVLAALEAKGVIRAAVTLHVGIGTFRPIETDDPSAHDMHHEWYEVSKGAATTINSARDAGGRVWAVGTTTVRTLESVVGADGRVEPGTGSTDLFIRPGYQFRAVDGILTNFHLPRSTLLMLVAARAGYRRTMGAYEVAIREGYRFYSYGDAMAVLPPGGPR
jgi:S-adenosylmethionine:tRNA ribosyltransferase-isomerase